MYWAFNRGCEVVNHDAEGSIRLIGMCSRVRTTLSSASKAWRSPGCSGGDALVEVLGGEQLGLFGFLARGGGADPFS